MTTLKEAKLTKKERAALDKSLKDSRVKGKNLTNIPERDEAQTPPYALLPLLPYIPKDWIIWESAAGMGLLSEAITALRGNAVIETDILDGEDFLTTPVRTTAQAQITNPPYSNPLVFKWIHRSYENRQPFALLMPLRILGAAKAQAMFQRYGMNIILFNRRVNFYMPYKGWDGQGSHYPVAWYCWGLPNLKQPVTYGYIPNPSPKAGLLPKWMVTPMSRSEIREGAKSTSDRLAIKQAADPLNSALAYEYLRR